jgi:hypothetical protein
MCGSASTNLPSMISQNLVSLPRTGTLFPPKQCETNTGVGITIAPVVGRGVASQSNVKSFSQTEHWVCVSIGFFAESF